MTETILTLFLMKYWTSELAKSNFLS